MKLLMIVLNDEDLVEPLLATLKENGVQSGTLIDTQGMNSLLYDLHPQQIPLFGSFRMWASNLHPSNKTFFSVIENDIEHKVLNVINQVFQGFENPGKGIAFTIPLDNVVGYRKYE